MPLPTTNLDGMRPCS